LESLGVKLSLSPEQVAQCISEVGAGFMFAPNHHPAMKNVVPIRKDLGVRTIFNILGPLTNPADAKRILMGVFHADLLGIQARVLQAMGMDHALVVYGRDGLDEISLEGPTLVGELKDGQVREYEIHPQDFGLSTAPTNSFKVANDSLKLKLFESLAVANDVNQTLENDTIKIDANIKLLGTIENIKLDYTIKPFKVTSNVKQYLLLGGIEAGSNQLLNEFRVKGNIQYLSPVKTLYTIGYDNQEIIYFGVSKKIFGFNREIKK